MDAPDSERQPTAAAMGHVLVVDDDGHIREVVRFALEHVGYRVTESNDGRSAWTLFEQQGNEFDLVVLDIVMPGLDGLDVCRRIRQTSKIPLIFLSSRDEELDRILGLELGADDYITKPFSPRELVARVKATLRRFAEVRAILAAGEARAGGLAGSQHSRDPQNQETLLRHGPLELNPVRHECRVSGQAVVLTVSEFGLLRALLERPGSVLSRKQLVDHAYGVEHYLSDRTVDSHVRRIRQKLKAAGHECVETVYGVGYRLVDEG